MTPDDKKQAARRLLGLTEQMLREARREDWAALAAMEGQRRELSEALFAEPVPAEAVETVSHCVRELLELDPEIQRLVQQARDEAGEAVRKTKTGKAALSAYRRYSR